MTEIISAITSVFTSAIGWVGTVAARISLTGSGLIAPQKGVACVRSPHAAPFESTLSRW